MRQNITSACVLVYVLVLITTEVELKLLAELKLNSNKKM